MTSPIRIAGLFVHPIKSAAAISVDALALDDRGAVADRRWLVIDEDGMQITARETPALATVRQRFVLGESSVDHDTRTNVDGALWIETRTQAGMRVDVPTTHDTRPVTVWNDTLDAHDAGDGAAAWFSDVLSRDCRLVRIDESSRRPLKAKYAGRLDRSTRRVAFSDGAPLLVLGQASVDALSERIVEQGGEAMISARFRPNILLSHTTPHLEDSWRAIRIGEVTFEFGMPCSRCVMTTIDPQTGERGVEPLKTLSTYRRQGGEVMFGMNVTNVGVGTVRVGDAVVVLDE